MLNAAIIGLGWWGKTLARAARSGGEIAIVAGATGRRALAEDFAAEQGFDLLDSYEQVLADPRVEAVILATPASRPRGADDRRRPRGQAHLRRKNRSR